MTEPTEAEVDAAFQVGGKMLEEGLKPGAAPIKVIEIFRAALTAAAQVRERATAELVYARSQESARSYRSSVNQFSSDADSVVAEKCAIAASNTGWFILQAMGFSHKEIMALGEMVQALTEPAEASRDHPGGEDGWCKITNHQRALFETALSDVARLRDALEQIRDKASSASDDDEIWMDDQTTLGYFIDSHISRNPPEQSITSPDGTVFTYREPYT